MRAGASRICIADTVGHATPDGARAVVRFARRVIDETRDTRLDIDWHGHRDRDMGTINSLAALEAGATRVHGTMLGLGERVGNTPMDLLLVNLVLMGWMSRDLTHLNDLVQAVSAATASRFPDNYPVFGRDAFRTATGVHAAARRQGVSQGTTGPCRHRVFGCAGAARRPLAGNRDRSDVRASNVVFWLERSGIEAGRRDGRARFSGGPSVHARC